TQTATASTVQSAAKQSVDPTPQDTHKHTAYQPHKIFSNQHKKTPTRPNGLVGVNILNQPKSYHSIAFQFAITHHARPPSRDPLSSKNPDSLPPPSTPSALAVYTSAQPHEASKDYT